MTKTVLKLFIPKYNISYMETSIMSVFSEVNRVKLHGKKYKMVIRQDKSEAVKTEKADENKTEDGQKNGTDDEQKKQDEKVTSENTNL